MIFNKNNSEKIIVKTFHGLEETLAREIEELGGTDVKTEIRMVSFRGDKEALYKANLLLRTALRVLLPFKTFDSKHPDNLYKQTKKIDWSKFFSARETFAIDSVVNSKYFPHSKFASLKVKDAIVDQFREKFGKRPSVDAENPDVRINLHIADSVCTLSLDSSGDSLHKRGYRLGKTRAPLNETLAAGLILLSGWRGEKDFIDPMCGSGTFSIEAAMIAKNIPPQINRADFGFFKWKDFDKELWEKVLRQAKRNIAEKSCVISASDVSGKSIEIAKENVKRAGLQNEIALFVSDIADLKIDSEEGTAIINPPYGERLKEENIFDFYKKIGDKLKKDFSGFDVWIFSANKEALKRIGLRTSGRLTLFNGPLETKFHKYEMYRGSKKASKNSRD